MLFFNRLSETMLINISPVWYFLLTFGLYGYRAEKLLDIIAANREPGGLRSARKVWFNEEGRHPLVAVLAHFFFSPRLCEQTMAGLNRPGGLPGLGFPAPCFP